MRGGAPHHQGQPTMHGGGPSHGGPVVMQQQYPAPPPPSHYPDNDHRSMHSEDWLGALVAIGLIGAILSNAGHQSSNYYVADY